MFRYDYVMIFNSQILLLSLIALFLSFPVAADTLPAEKPPLFTNFCEKAITPADHQSCTQKRFENAELTLKRQFQSFLIFLKDTPHFQEIKNAQNSWMDYRNKECSFEASFFEEEITKRTLELSCRSRLTEARALVLYNFIPRVRTQLQQKSMN